MEIRQYNPEDEPAIIKLWQKCDLTRPWNNPKRDIDRKLTDSPDLLFAGLLDGKIVASVMAGYIIWLSIQIIGNRGLAER